MDLKEILTISGQSGLFKLISQGKNAVIVENLASKKRMPAYASSRISSMEDIAIFTQESEIPLKEVFVLMFRKESGKKVADPKKLSGDELKAYFTELVPDYDKVRVYTSDIKKALLWYNELIDNELIEDKPEVISEVAEADEQAEEAKSTINKSFAPKPNVPKPGAKKIADQKPREQMSKDQKGRKKV